jgi:hypothetical protein
MNAATGHFVSTGAIAEALKVQLQAVQVVIGTAPAAPAFQRIELFDSESLLEAFQLLTISEQRICIIVPMTDHFETDVKTRNLISLRITPFVLLISDRVMGNRTAALYGDAKTPGAFKLTALTIPFVTGQLIANPNGVVSYPTSSDVVIVKNEKEKQNLPGRAAVALELDCKGGWIEAALGPGITL